MGAEWGLVKAARGRMRASEGYGKAGGEQDFDFVGAKFYLCILTILALIGWL